MNRSNLTSTLNFLSIATGFLIAFIPTNQLHAQCPLPPTTFPNGAVEGQVNISTTNGRSNASVAIDAIGTGRFIVAWQTTTITGSSVSVLRFDASGTCIPDPVVISSVSSILPSVAMSRDSSVTVGFLATGVIDFGMKTLVASSFDFDTFAPPPAQTLSALAGDHEPSIGISNLSGAAPAAAWSNDSETTGLPGLLYEAQPMVPASIRLCGASQGGAPCFVEETFPPATAWQPVVCQRSDGVMAVAWADAETPAVQDSFFNVKLQLFDSSGVLIGPEVLVNDPGSEALPSTQQSPAVAFDDAGNLVCVWVGANLPGCNQGGVFRIFARRFLWSGNPAVPPVAVSEPFRVDSATNAQPLSGVGANPTVSLSLDNSGKFIVAWNVSVPPTPPDHNPRDEIRAQFFDGNGRVRGAEFRINQDISNTDNVVGINVRRLTNSAQHTIAYGGRVVATWASFSGSFFGPPSPKDVHFTLLPADFPQQQEALAPCIKGDVDRNGVVDGLDIQPFVDLMLGNPACRSIVDICPADIDNNAAVEFNDVPGFVCLLLGVPCGQSGQRGGAGNIDCNANGTPDATDILLGTSQDCNANFIPDECDVDPADPDGDGLVSNDLNANGIPDECEPDCNSNGIPDDKDIADATSADLNANGIPDECDPDCNGNGIPDEMDVNPADPDGNGQVSPDCNGNGVPDECEDDCNVNGVPDDCDVDPTDPDGNGQVSPDCNGNGWPDECDLALAQPFGSLDCNANGIPDECDIASGTSQDCNANGFPDECDIATGISQDANANGIPDECEAQQSQGGGGSSPAPTATTSTLSEPQTQQAYTDFYNWCQARQWGASAPTTCSQQFQAMVDKMRELGLPLEAP